MTIPNILTLARILLIPFFCVFAFDTGNSGFWVTSHPRNFLVAGLIFVVAAATDFLDGYLARKWNQTTNVGKLLDPLADKLLITSALIALVENRLVAGWTVVIILSREFLITGLRSMLADAGVKASGASNLGKTKTVLQIAAIIAFLFDIDKYVNNTLYFLAVLFTIISGVDYLWKSRQYLKFK